MTVLEFVKSKGVPESVYGSMDAKALRGLARALDPQFKAPAESTAEIREYTPEKGKSGTGMYLITQIGNSRESFSRLCDGKVLTEEGARLALALADSIADAVAASQK